jgi:uncharacterized MnhB-related membrane protein
MDDLYVDGMAVAKIVCHSREHLSKIVTRLLLSFSLSTLLFAYLQAPDVAEVMMSALRRAQS